MASVTRARNGAPDVTVDETGGYFTATVDVIDLEPTRTVNAVEAANGVISLYPVVVRSRQPRALVDLACKTTLSAAWATSADLSPGECVSIHIRVASEVRRALNQMGYAT